MTVVDLVADALARGGARWLCVGAEDGESSLVAAAARSQGLRVVRAGSARAACVMAAVTGSLLDAPGAAAVPAGGASEAVAQAMRDRAPLIVIVAAPPDGELAGRAKASVVVDAATAAHWSAHAIQCALTEPRGPVIVVVSPAVAGEASIPMATSVRPAALPAPPAAALDEAARVLGEAVRPVLVAGAGCGIGDGAIWVRALAEALPAPVLVTAKGKGAMPDPHPLHLGLLDGEPSPVLARADLLVTIGVDAAEVPPAAWPADLAVLHLAASPWAAPVPRPPAGHTPSRGLAPAEIVGPISLVLEELAPRLRGRQRADWDVAEIARYKRVAPAGARAPAARGLTRDGVVAIVREAMPPGTVAVIAAGGDDGDLIAAWQAVAPGELVAPAPPALPGFALPAALAARLARPAARVVCFASAREILEAAPELETVCRLELPLLVLVVGARAPASAEPVPAGPLCPPGWSTTAIASESDLRRAIERGLTSTRPVLIDARGGA